METVIITGIFAVFFAYMERYKSFNYGLEISFFLIFLFLALRFNYGNDYTGYYEMFQYLKVNNLESVSSLHENIEIGWHYLNRLFLPFGFFTMIAVIAFFNCIVYYKIIKEFVPRNYYWLSIFLYVFNPYLMLVQSSAMRQTIVILLFLLAIRYFLQKRIIYYIMIIVFGSFFHSSSWILLIIIPLNYIDFKINNRNVILFTAFFISLFSVGYFLYDFLEIYMELFFPQYLRHLNQNEVIDLKFGIGAFIMLIILIVTLTETNSQEKKIQLIFKIFAIGFLIIPLSLHVWLISRGGFYFTALSILVYPNIIVNMKKNIYQNILLLLFISLTLYDFYIFFFFFLWIEDFGTYQTIINK